MSAPNMMKKSSCNRRRFSDDQIRSLETTFETESRPELRLKQHLANKLGLQPRQVAIWFQNKRARSKSKQIEGQFSVLKSNYDELASRFEALRQENESLLLQLQRLRKMAEKREEEESGNKNEYTESHRFVVDMNHEVLSGKGYEVEEEADVLDMVRIAEGSLASPDNGCSFESGTFLDGDSGRLWDF